MNNNDKYELILEFIEFEENTDFKILEFKGDCNSKITEEDLSQYKKMLKEKEDLVLSKFESQLSTKYKLVRNYIPKDNLPSATIMAEDGFPYCVIEVKFPLKKSFDTIKKRVLENAKNKQAKYVIITDGEKYWFYDYVEDKQNYVEVKQNDDSTFEKIIKKINENSEYYKDKICKYFKNNLDVNIKPTEIDTNYSIIDKDKETELINKLFHFEDFQGAVYRYVPLKSLFKTLQDGTILMSGLLGMNDVSEVDYVEKFLYGTSLNSDEINNIFILSCSIDKDDDLTQWRLYADDAKGARLKFDNFDFERNSTFIFRKIKYIDTDDFEPLKKLKRLIKYVKRVTGYTFVFKTFHDWCHFIKPKDYAVESEVRLLYKLNENESHEVNDWILTYGNITNPYMKFYLNNFYDDREDKDNKIFPLKLIDIKLGPKCPERETNKHQLNKLIQEKQKVKKETDNIEKIDVLYSNIKNYR